MLEVLFAALVLGGAISTSAIEPSGVAKTVENMKGVKPLKALKLFDGKDDFSINTAAVQYVEFDHTRHLCVKKISVNGNSNSGSGSGPALPKTCEECQHQYLNSTTFKYLLPRDRRCDDIPAKRRQCKAEGSKNTRWFYNKKHDACVEKPTSSIGRRVGFECENDCQASCVSRERCFDKPVGNSTSKDDTGSVTRWYFSSDNNTCEEHTTPKKSASAKGFNSYGECTAICGDLPSCV